MYLEKEKFSIWCDFVERDFLKNEFVSLIDGGKINGATSNPAIFKNAFLTSPAYEESKSRLSSKSKKEIYEALAIEDIKIASNVLKPLYEKDDDGFISIEVDPNLCFDAKGTIKEGRKLYKSIDAPNVMIKIPATEAGYEAMEVLISEGININATLIFSPTQAKLCLDAFEKGLSKLEGKKPKAVISVFVSRFDRLLDPSLPQNLKGKVGIFNASKIYNLIQKRALKEVRCLFASTGVKGDDYPKDYYISELLYPNSINTAPLETIKAFLATNNASIKTLLDNNKIDKFFAQLKDESVDIESVYDNLLNDGLKAFVKAYNQIIQEI